MNIFQRTFGFIHHHPLAKKHLIKSYLNFISWQFKSRLNKDFQPIKFVNQTYFLAKRGLTGVTGNIYTGLHEFNEMGFLLHFLQPADVFFDVGANVGSYTLLASGVCNSKTVAFEPIPRTFEILMQNVELNKLQDLILLENKGVGKSIGTLNFIANEDTTNHVVADHEFSLDKISVPITTLDSYANIYSPSLIKIDVEGYETEVLNGASKILRNLNLKAIILELNGSGARYGYNEDYIHNQLVAQSFEPFSYDPFSRTLEKLKSFGEYNTIYIRDIDFVQNRLTNAKGFTLFDETI